MDVRNCRKCGRIFNYVVGPFICPRCREAMENKFQEVKSYVKENPGVSVPEVSEACEVESAQIYQWLREERLELTDGSAITLSCESCGRSIKSGKYCEQCKRELTTGFNKAIAKERPREQDKHEKKDSSSKMRYLERDK